MANVGNHVTDDDQHFNSTFDIKSENGDEEIPAENQHKNTDKLADTDFDGRYRKMEKEDAMIFGSDSWLKHCVEMEEEEVKDEKKPKVPLLIKIKKEDKNVGEYLNENLKSSQDSGKANEFESSSNWTKYPAEIETGKQRNVNGRKSNKSKNPESLSLIMRNAPVEKTETSGKCCFECPACHSTYKSWGGFSRHMTRDHNRQSRLSEWERFAKNVSVHICRICSKRVLCDSMFVAQHLKTIHDITIRVYVKKYISDSYWIQHEEMLKKGRMSENIIGNHCTFKCPNCNKTFYCYYTFQSHGQKSKKHCVNSKFKDLPKHIQEIVIHKCKICSKVILCSRELIRTHVQGHKFKTLPEYAQRTGCLLEDNCPNRCQDTFDRVTKGAKVSKQVGNFCRYTCSTCGHVTTMWRYMRQHLKKSGHGSSVTNKWYKCISKTVLYQCLICDKKVLNGTEFVQKHVSEAHQKTLLQYLKEYNVGTHIRNKLK